MRDIQVSRPALIALIGAILVGGFLFYKSNSSEDVAPPPPAQAAATAATGATGATGGSGATGESMTAAEKREARRKEAHKKLLEAAEAAGMPLNVFEPLKEHKIVMLFFWEPDGDDDQHVNQSVKEVKNIRGSKLVVIKEKISNKSKYDGIAKVADITQTPGIVIMYGKRADTWQGYIDGTALNARVSRLLQAEQPDSL